jgi:hypothetical protein
MVTHFASKSIIKTTAYILILILTVATLPSSPGYADPVEICD